MKPILPLRGFGRSAATVVLCLIALDLVASLVTLAIGAEVLKR